MASTSELTCIYSALILHNSEVTVMENEIKAPFKAAGVNVEPFWPGLFAKTLANVNIEMLICNVRAGGPAPAAGAVPGGPASTTAARAEEKKVEAKKEESEESDDDLGFGLFCDSLPTSAKSLL